MPAHVASTGTALRRVPAGLLVVLVLAMSAVAFGAAFYLTRSPPPATPARAEVVLAPPSASAASSAILVVSAPSASTSSPARARPTHAQASESGERCVREDNAPLMPTTP